MMALAEMENAEVIGREVLKPGGGRGLSAFWGYYVLEALAKADDMGAALDMVREYWGAMIKLGATTFWEEFDLDWAADAAGIDAPVPEGMKDIHGDFGEFCYRQFRRSLCHGWASGPTAFLSRKVLGIELLEPGFRKVKIVPRLGGLNWVRGSIPTPYGLLHVEHHMEGGVIHSQVNAPEGVEVLIT